MIILAPKLFYPTDLTNGQWELVADLFRRKRGPGRPTTVDLRQAVNAIIYLVRTGCQWRMIPKQYPPWTTVRYYYDKWTDNGTWQQLNRLLRQMCRVSASRQAEPSLGLIDSQSVKTTEVGGIKGFDGGKLVKGRKRQILTDSLGNLLGATVHAGNESDQEGGGEDEVKRYWARGHRLRLAEPRQRLDPGQGPCGDGGLLG